MWDVGNLYPSLCTEWQLRTETLKNTMRKKLLTINITIAPTSE